MTKSFENIELAEGKKIFFVSDVHLGAPNHTKSREREDKLVRFLNKIEHEAAAIFIIGDLFDFWFEYQYVIPKGFVRIQGKLAELADRGLPIIMFTGNHDMWLFDYFPKEFGIQVVREPKRYTISGKRFLIGHGDGLGPGDAIYKILKKFFANKLCQRLFAFLHPWIGFSIATKWSASSRSYNDAQTQKLIVENEWLYQFCKETEAKEHFDYYVFGHRHLPLEMPVGENSVYMNTGEWLSAFSFAWFDGERLSLEIFKG